MEKIVGIGEILWDVFPDGAELGGAVLNFAMHVNSMGMEGIVISSLGRDSLGTQALKICDDRNLKYIIKKRDEPTGTVIVELDNEGKATYDFTKDSAWDYIELDEEALSLAKECRGVCFGSLAQRSEFSRNSIYKFLENTNKSCIKIFDINIREDYYSKEIIEGSLKHANVLKLNDEELPLIIKMFDLPTDEDSALKLLKDLYSLDLIILTMGADGSRLYRSETDNSFIIPEKTTVVDTVGAGDSFTATVIVGLIKGDSLDVINKRANLVAAYVCTQKGGTPDLSSLGL